MRSLILTLFALLALNGCSKPVEVDPDIAEQPVPQFHMSLNAGQIEEIYKRSAEDLRQHESLQDFSARLNTVRQKLGPVQGANRQSWSAEEKRGDIFVTLHYKSTYAGGEAEESFVMRMHDGVSNLAGYQIKAAALGTP